MNHRQSGHISIYYRCTGLFIIENIDTVNGRYTIYVYIYIRALYVKHNLKKRAEYKKHAL